MRLKAKLLRDYVNIVSRVIESAFSYPILDMRIAFSCANDRMRIDMRFSYAFLLSVMLFAVTQVNVIYIVTKYNCHQLCKFFTLCVSQAYMQRQSISVFAKLNTSEICAPVKRSRRYCRIYSYGSRLRQGSELMNYDNL